MLLHTHWPKRSGVELRWVKKWRKRLAAGDLQDPSVLCSYSRAHHAPSFRWDVLVTQKMVEMRLAPPENLQRVPGPRALLYYLPRDESVARGTPPLAPLQPNERARSCMRLVVWSRVPKSHPIPPSCESPWKRSRWMQKEGGSVSPDQSPQGKRQHVVEVCNAGGRRHFDGPLCPGPRGFPRTNRVGGGARLLAKVRMPTADDEFFAIHVGLQGCQVGIFPPHCGGSGYVPGDSAA